VYEWFEKKETSVLPAHAAANPYNPSMEVVPMKMSDGQRKLLDEIQPGLAQHVEETGEKLTDDLEKAGVDFKEASEKDAPAAEVKEEPTEAPSDEVVSSLTELLPQLAKELQLDGLSDALAAHTEALKAIATSQSAVVEEVQAQNKRLDALEKDEVEKLAEKESALPRYFWFQGSDVAETVLKKGDPLQNAQPGKGGSPIRAIAGIADMLDRGIGQQ